MADNDPASLVVPRTETILESSRKAPLTKTSNKHLHRSRKRAEGNFSPLEPKDA